MTQRIATFYRFFPVADPPALCAAIQAIAAEAGLLGTVLVATEGVNANLVGKAGLAEPAVEALVHLLEHEGPVMWSEAEEAPFRRLRVRVRDEIVTFGEPRADPIARTARHVDAEEWRRRLDDDRVLVLDVRNDYEIHAGRFRGALAPETETFADFARFVDHELSGHEARPIAMYCTGGIRCEKASSLLFERGFEDVVQLRGGVLGYFEQTRRDPAEDDVWAGECFVFDGRTTVRPDLRPGTCVTCRRCGWPVRPDDQDEARFAAGLGCPQCADHGSPIRHGDATGD